MKGRKRVYIDWTYYEPGNPAAIAARFTKNDSDCVSYIRESDAKKEIADWKRSSEEWKKAFNHLVSKLPVSTRRKVFPK